MLLVRVAVEDDNEMLPKILLAINWDTFTTDLIEWMFYPFTNILGSLFWVIIFSIVIGMSWIISRDIGVVLGVTLVTFGIFGGTNAFLGASEYSFFFSVVATLCFAGLVIQIFVKKWGG